MPAGLLAPYIPDSSEWFRSAGQGYAQGEAIRNRNLRVDAGGQAAEGDMAGAKSTLYEGGDFEGGNQVNQMMRQASDDALKKTERFHSTLGNLALAADTPEKWASAVGAAKNAGMDVSKYGDFSARQMLLAQSGKTIEALNMEVERRKIAAAAKPEFEFNKYGVGNKYTGEFKPYAAGAGGDPGKLGSDQRWRMKNGALDLDASGRPIAEPIPGSSKEAIPAEVAARVGLADKFQKNVPKIKTDIEAGKLGTSFGYDRDFGLDLDFQLGRGKAGELYRQIEDGAEALVRNLTGAGMNKDEAESYARRFLPGRLDGRPTVLSKLEGLQSSLESVRRRVMTGRGIASVDDLNEPVKEQGQLTKEAGTESKELVQVTKEQYDALEPGERYLDPNGDIRTKAKK